MWVFNRGDKSQIMFNQLIYKNALNQKKAVHLNRQLKYDKDGIQCNSTLKIAWTDLSKHFYLLHIDGIVEHCILKNGQNINGKTLFMLILKDLGFLGRKWISNQFFKDNDGFVDCTYYKSGNLKCLNDKSICINPDEECDGVVQCPGGSDEDLSKCDKYFPPTAEVECQKQVGNNISIKIKATKCNGIVECDDNKDETDCQDFTSLTYLILFVLFLVSILSSTIIMSLTKLNQHGELLLDFENRSEKDLRDLVVLYSETETGKLVCKELYSRLLRNNGGNFARTINELKVSTVLNFV